MTCDAVDWRVLGAVRECCRIGAVDHLVLMLDSISFVYVRLCSFILIESESDHVRLLSFSFEKFRERVLETSFEK